MRTFADGKNSPEARQRLRICGLLLLALTKIYLAAPRRGSRKKQVPRRGGE